MWKVVAAFFSANIMGGILLGLDIIWSLHYFFTRGITLFYPRKDNIIPWVDISISTVLLKVSFASPSLAVMLIFTAWTVRLYLRVLMHKNDPNYWLNKTIANIKIGFKWVKEHVKQAWGSGKQFWSDMKSEARKETIN